MKLNILRFWLIQIASIATLILFVSLGTWQLGRGNVKSDIEAASTDNHEVYKNIQFPLENIESWRYKKIVIEGVYDDAKQFLLDNQVRDRISGYNVLTPIFIEKQDVWVLVDRGWTPLVGTRKQLPNVDISNNISTSITGTVYVPYAEAYSLGGIADGEDSGWPRRIQYVDYQQLSERLGVQLQPFTLRIDANEENGFRRDWAENNITAQKHYGYSFQWYAMAVALVVLWWIYSIKPLIKNK